MKLKEFGEDVKDKKLKKDIDDFEKYMLKKLMEEDDDKKDRRIK